MKRNLSTKRILELRAEWANLECIIIDEVSLLNHYNFGEINKQLNQIFCETIAEKIGPDSGIKRKNKDGDEEKMTNFFGNKMVILVGDYYQLPPVKERFIFEDTKRPEDSKLIFSGGLHIFRDLFYMIELTQQQRQKGDPKFTNLLNLIRKGELFDYYGNVLNQEY